jgi:hypothetical protein
MHKTQVRISCSAATWVAALVASLVASLVGGCEGCDSLRTLVVPTETEITVPGAAILGSNPLVPAQVFPASALSQALAAALAQSISTEGVNKAAVDSLKLTAMTLTVKDPQQGGRQIRGLGFLQSLVVDIGAEGAAPVAVAASADGAFAGTPGPVNYDMPLTDAELVEVFKASDALDVTADVTPGNPPNFETTVVFATEMTVLVNVGGAIFGE